jgi:hypothetical protein
VWATRSRAVGDLTRHYASVEVPYHDGVAQISFFQDRQHVVDVGPEPDVRDVNVLVAQPGQRHRADAMAELAQPAGHRRPHPGSHPGAGDQDEVTHVPSFIAVAAAIPCYL